MNPYYKTLEIEQGADKQTIKKAYFQMIRKYPPDKNPAEFKKVREAYEYLQKEENLQNLEKAAGVPPEFEKPYYQVLEFRGSGQTERAIELCLAVLQIAEMQPFQILLAACYNENENYGKAAALWEKLNSKQKNNPEFLMGLMTAYQGRNWVQKAIRAGEELDRLKYSDLSYYCAYAKLWYSREDYRPLQEIGAKAVTLYEAAEKHTEQEAEYLCQTLACMLRRDAECSLSSVLADAKDAEPTVRNGIREPACSKVFAGFSLHLYLMFAERVKRYPEYLTLLQLYQPIVQSGTHFYDEEERLQYLNAECKTEHLTLLQDEEISSLIKDNFGAWYADYMFSHVPKKERFGLDPSVVDDEGRYDNLLYWLTLLDKLLPSFRKIAEAYPHLAKAMSPHLEELLNENPAVLRKKYEKHYKKLMGYPASASLVLNRNDRAGNETYKRETKKVGRNDPCPCGSGRKYKQCCGKNQ